MGNAPKELPFGILINCEYAAAEQKGSTFAGLVGKLQATVATLEVESSIGARRRSRAEDGLLLTLQVR
jgi:hypothetical protein